jgi:tRNA U34 5-carboxymethylaminomethyl modifying GTPase MnmE/TrmE
MVAIKTGPGMRAVDVVHSSGPHAPDALHEFPYDTERKRHVHWMSALVSSLK